MRQKWARTLSLMLCLGVLMTGTALAADAGMAAPPAGGGAGGGAPTGDGAPTNAAIVITDGTENTTAEYEPGAYSDQITTQDGVVTIDGLKLTSGDYTFNGLVATGAGSVVRLQKATIRLSTDSDVTDDDTGGAATNIDDGATLYISDSNLIVDGAARYVTANYNDAKLIVNNSTIESTGSNDHTAAVSEPFSNAALLISGTARANFSIGATKTYYFNSTCTAEGWAALSTDSATGDGLDLYAYNTDGITEHGGYGTYADTNCRVWLYGSRLTAAEIGCIISKNGQIHAYASDAAPDDVMSYNEGDTVQEDSTIMGGRNAVMIHAPDMMGQGLAAADCGSFSAENTSLVTTKDLVSTKDYSDYGEATGAYIDYVSGAIFLIRSTSANIDLKNVTMDSYDGVLVQTVLNADSMGNFLASGDGDQVNPVAVNMTDMDVTGDIRHEDYQRKMTVDLENTTLSGNIISGAMEDWNNTWSKYGDVNWVVDDSFDAVYGVALTVGKDAVWNVTGKSSLTSLTVAEGGTINGEVQVDGQTVTPEAGKTYTGTITVTGDYDPDAEEASVVPEEDSASVLAATPSEAVTPALSATPAPSAAVSAQPEASSSSNQTAVIVIVVILIAVAIIVVGVVLSKRKKKD